MQDRINNNAESPKSPMDTLDNLLESIAFESNATNNYLTELINGEINGNTRLIPNNINNSITNHKTDTLNRYLDNVINFNNNELSSYHNHNNIISNNIRKSDSEGSSSDHNNGKMPHQVTTHAYYPHVLISFIKIIHCQCQNTHLLANCLIFLLFIITFFSCFIAHYIHE